MVNSRSNSVLALQWKMAAWMGFPMEQFQKKKKNRNRRIHYTAMESATRRTWCPHLPLWSLIPVMWGDQGRKWRHHVLCWEKSRDQQPQSMERQIRVVSLVSRALFSGQRKTPFPTQLADAITWLPSFSTNTRGCKCSLHQPLCTLCQQYALLMLSASAIFLQNQRTGLT